MPFKRLITGKKQPGKPGRSSEVRGGSSRSLEEVAKMEGPTPAREQEKQANRQQQQHPHPKAEVRKDEARRVRRLSKPSEQIGRTVRLDVGLGG